MGPKDDKPEKQKYEDMKKKPFHTGNNSPNWSRILTYLLVWAGVFYFLSLFFNQDVGRQMSYTEFKAAVRQGKVEEVTFKGDVITGELKGSQKGDGVNTQNSALGGSPDNMFKTVKPDLGDPELLDLLERRNVVIKAEPQGRGWLEVILVSFLPWVLIIGFFVWASRRFQQMGGGMKGGGPFSFGKSKAKQYKKTDSMVSFADVAGLDNAKKELSEMVDFLKEPGRFRKLGGKLPKGILLVGPPGCGKTLLAKAVAGEADVPFFSISGSEFIEMFVGVGASRVRDMFENAKKEAPAILFIDELDSIGRVRGTGVGGGHDEREQTLNQILSEMDGFLPHQSVIVLAATNRPDVLDPALVRPGRFDRRVTINLPQKNARQHILEVHTRNVPLEEDVDLKQLSAATVGFSGAELENIVNEAALIAGREKKRKVGQVDFEKAIDKIRMGIEREDFLTDKDKKIVAYHEAGHAMMARLLAGADPLKKVSIIPRGRALGATEQMPEEDRQNFSRTYLRNRIAVMLGGRVAESLVFGDITSGAADDLKKSSQLARRMVCNWGMSEKIGPVTFKLGDTHPFLGRELSESKDYSEYTAKLIDDEVADLIRENEKKARELLSEHRRYLDQLANALLERETMTNKEIDQLFHAKDGEAKAAS